MKRIFLFCICCFYFNCSSTLPVCDKAIQLRIESRNAVGEKKLMLENEVAGLEEACARERANSYEQFKSTQQRNHP